MSQTYLDAFTEVSEKQADIAREFVSYWAEYSNPTVGFFWVNTFMLVAPLVYLYFKMDRSKALLLGFYGFNIHVWFTYIDTSFVRFGLVGYPFQTFPLITANLGLDVSLIPVLFMFVYQYVLNHNKNYYLYTIGLSAGLAFIFKPYLVVLKMFRMHESINYLHLFVAYVVVLVMARLITNLFLHFMRTSKTTT
ncbi:CBO0543 family protein [Halalkalibacter akibai]|uniref:Uncharacterized protein n=1 Tax=Halalkalibacter akibai (strain ATCC 43226 / DSM 21942 / CIP 109018 / JCM 9157 / 1139) TaxID=1236973 RepID=W4QMD7_HALA3|nr:CBO0543 family protein [Halalkalibacter akibai]GAE33261.1 hypothetical protein JCM9157_255 [Halalkalibacter akibai JCM 9157]